MIRHKDSFSWIIWLSRGPWWIHWWQHSTNGGCCGRWDGADWERGSGVSAVEVDGSWRFADSFVWQMRNVKSVKCEYNVFSWSYFWYGEVQRVRRQDCDPRSRPNTAAAAQAILAAASDKRAAALQLLDVGTSGKKTDIVSFFPFILPVFSFPFVFHQLPFN